MENVKESPKTKGVVSVKLNDADKSALAQQAEKEGITISQLLRKKLKEESKEPPGSSVEKVESDTKSINLSTEALLNIDALIDEKLGSVNENFAALNSISPVKDYLKKLAGETPENPATFTDQEDKAFKEIVEAMKAENIENLLLEHNSVPISPLFENEIQRRTFKEMLEKRNEIVSEKMPSFNQVFMKAIGKAFDEDCRSAYNKNLFKAMYGFTYDEFKAVFFPE